MKKIILGGNKKYIVAIFNILDENIFIIAENNLFQCGVRTFSAKRREMDGEGGGIEDGDFLLPYRHFSCFVRTFFMFLSIKNV